MGWTKSRISTVLGLCFWWLLFAWELYFVYGCLEALFTGEIGFGRSSSIVDIDEQPGWFWFAFWFQLILGVAALPVIWQQISGLRKNGTARDSDTPSYDKDFIVEVSQISSHGIFLNTREKELYMSYDNFPWLKSQSFQAICNVEQPSSDRYYWPEIGVDLTLEMIEHPERFSLKANNPL